MKKIKNYFKVFLGIILFAFDWLFYFKLHVVYSQDTDIKILGFLIINLIALILIFIGTRQLIINNNA